MKRKRETTDGDTPRIIKDGRVKIRPTMLHRSGLPIEPYDWSDKLPELVLIISLLQDHNAFECVALFRRFADSVPKKLLPTNGFRAGVTEFAEILQKARDGREAIIDPIVEEIFTDNNRSILRVFDLPGKTVLNMILKESSTPTQEDFIRVMGVVAAAAHGKSGRALRAKLVQLVLMDPHGARFRLDFCELEPILSVKSDDISEFIGRTGIQTRWGGVTIATSDEEQTVWTTQFWEHGMATPCFMAHTRKGRERIALSKGEKRLVGKIDRLWRRIAQEMPLNRALFVSDVLLALTSRIWRFMHHILETSGAGNGELAEISARCQWESSIYLEWLISKNDIELFHRFRTYSVGKAKTSVERIRGDRDSYGGEEASRIAENILVSEIHDGAGLWEQLVAEEVGAWSPKGTKQMADDVSATMEYELHFRRLSDIVHGLWRDLERYHVVKCANPMHRGHCLAWTGPTCDAGKTPVCYAIWVTVRALKAFLGHMGDIAEDTWGIRLEGIERETHELMKQHHKQWSADSDND